MSLFKKQLPILIVSILTILLLIETYFNIPSVSPSVRSINTSLLSWGVIIGYFAIMIGSVSLFRHHITKIYRREKYQWIHSTALLISFVIVSVVGIVLSPTSELYKWIFNNLNLLPITAVGSLGLFWLISAFYRSFRIKNVASLLLLLACLISLLGAIPLGGFLAPAKQWIDQVPTKGASMGILITTAIGTVAVTYRIMMGKEKGTLGISEE